LINPPKGPIFSEGHITEDGDPAIHHEAGAAGGPVLQSTAPNFFSDAKQVYRIDGGENGGWKPSKTRELGAPACGCHDAVLNNMF